MDITKLRRRIEDRLRKGAEADIVRVAHFLGMDEMGWITLESSASGDEVETRYGTLRATNGHFSFTNLAGMFWIAKFPATICYCAVAGDARSCGVYKFHIERLEEAIAAQL